MVTSDLGNSGRQQESRNKKDVTDVSLQTQTDRPTCVEVVADQFCLEGLRVGHGQRRWRVPSGHSSGAVHICPTEDQAQGFQQVTALHVYAQSLQRERNGHCITAGAGEGPPP